MILTQTDNDSSLKEVFEGHFLIGCSINQHQFMQDNNFGLGLVKKHYNTITPENSLKWERVHPEPNEYNFDFPDKLIEFGRKNNIAIIGHTLVWHSQTPAWVFKDEDGNPADRETLLNRMRDHIYTVVGRYKGKIKGWDVVNEALNEDGSLRQSKWFEIIGEDYITKAFQYAHEADPDAELYYNDYSLANKPKRDGAVELVKNLQSQGIKVAGIGMQGHYKMDWPSPEQIDSSIKAFAALGVNVMITELDMDVLPYKNLTADVGFRMKSDEKNNPYKDGLPESVQEELAERYADLFRVFTDNSKSVSRVTFWGITDRDSWLNNWPVRGRSNYPLLFDRNGGPKPAFKAVMNTVLLK
ncbi:MAG: endo-1,4-beta-xylanase [Melioribacteraceae bacterium]|nr:endo-1,4-beta-xylanase [Melioribacteraceae bacterium]